MQRARASLKRQRGEQLAQFKLEFVVRCREGGADNSRDGGCGGVTLKKDSVATVARMLVGRVGRPTGVL